jgi:hypothetical protein
MKVVMGVWRRIWPALAGVGIGLMVAHLMRDGRVAPGIQDPEYRRTPAAEARVQVPELPPAGRPLRPSIKAMAAQTP